MTSVPPSEIKDGKVFVPKNNPFKVSLDEMGMPQLLPYQQFLCWVDYRDYALAANAIQKERSEYLGLEYEPLLEMKFVYDLLEQLSSVAYEFEFVNLRRTFLDMTIHGCSFKDCAVKYEFHMSQDLSLSDISGRVRFCLEAFFKNYPDLKTQKTLDDVDARNQVLRLKVLIFLFMTDKDFSLIGGPAEFAQILLMPNMLDTLLDYLGQYNCRDIKDYQDFLLLLEHLAYSKEFFTSGIYQKIFDEFNILTRLDAKPLYFSWISLIKNGLFHYPEVSIEKFSSVIQEIIEKDWPELDKNYMLGMLLESFTYHLGVVNNSLFTNNISIIQGVYENSYLKSIPQFKNDLKLIGENINRKFYGIEENTPTSLIQNIEKKNENSIIFLVEIEGRKKKITIPKSSRDVSEELSNKLSISMEAYMIDIFDEECGDWIVFDSSEHNFHNAKQPIKIRLSEKISNDPSECNIVKIDHYKIFKMLRSDVNSVGDVHQTMIAEEQHLNKEAKKVLLKYYVLKGNKSEEQLSEFIMTLKKAKDYSKANIIQIIDIFKPESINNSRLGKLQHIAFTMPYYSHGSLASLKREKVNITPRVVLSILKYTLEAMNSLEEAHLPYGNLKEENILVEHLDLPTNSIKIRLSDWWKNATGTSQPQLNLLGTILYNVLTGSSLDVHALLLDEGMSSQVITSNIKKKQGKESSSLNIVTDVILFLLGKSVYSNSTSQNTARQSLKFLYKLVKDSQQK